MRLLKTIEHEPKMRLLKTHAHTSKRLGYDIYLRLPPGCGSVSGKVVLLNKALLRPEAEWSSVV